MRDAELLVLLVQLLIERVDLQGELRLDTRAQFTLQSLALRLRLQRELFSLVFQARLALFLKMPGLPTKSSR